MRTTLGLIAAVLLVLGGAAVWWLGRGPDASQFADLREPRLTRMPDQRMLVVEAVGDPNAVAGTAFKQIYDAYFKLEGISRMGRPPAPRARWQFSLETPRDKWIGWYALPVPDAVVAPRGESRAPARPDIERLRAFIASRGFRVIGEHEEEYVKGPGMLFAGDRDTYLTIIRLRVTACSS